jgi:25S rRNA (cytosine2278-C5)-methyltransferase
LLTKLQANQSRLDHILNKTEILQKIPNAFLAKILVAELIFGRGKLNGNSKPVECVLANEEALKSALAELEDNGDFPQPKLQQYKGKKMTVKLI